MTSNPPLHGIPALYALLITQALSMIGSRMTVIGLGFWLFERTHTTTPLLLAAFFTELPGMLLSSLAGAVVDRVPRKPVLIGTDAGLALCTLVLLAAIWTNTFSVPLLYTAALIQGCISIFQGPAKEASLALMIPAAQRDRMNGVQQMAFPFAGVVAPALTGLVYAVGGIAAIIAVDLSTFVLAAATLLCMSIPQPLASEFTDQGSSLWHDARAGLRFLRQQPGLLLLLLNSVVSCYLLNGSLEMTVPYVVTLTGSQATTGLVMMAMSLGAFTGGAIIAARANVQRRVRWMMVGGLLTALMYGVYGLTRSPWLLASALFLLLIPLPMGGALMNSLLQSRVPPPLQGRIFAISAQLGFIGSTASFLSIGPLVDRLLEPGIAQPWWHFFAPLVGSQPGAGMALLMVVTGVVMAVSTLLIWSAPSVRQLDAAE